MDIIIRFVLYTVYSRTPLNFTAARNVHFSESLTSVDPDPGSHLGSVLEIYSFWTKFKKDSSETDKFKILFCEEYLCLSKKLQLNFSHNYVPVRGFWDVRIRLIVYFCLI